MPTSTVHWLLVVSSAPPLPPLLRDAPLAVASLDLSGHIYDANRALLAAGGYTLDELRGRPFFEFLDPVGASDARRQFTSLASGEVPMYRGERRYRARDGIMHGDGAPAGSRR